MPHRLLGTMLAAGTIVMTMGMTTPASALLAGPFGDCPYGVSTLCFNMAITGGNFMFGNISTPLTGKIALQGGLLRLSDFETEVVIAASDGQTLSSTPLNIPGGLTGMLSKAELGGIGWTPSSTNTVTAQVQIAGPDAPGHLTNAQLSLGLGGDGLAVRLPLKIHVMNPVLGPNCYIGSNASPINLALTVATTSPPPPNHPITGSSGVLAPGSAPVGDQSVITLMASAELLVDNSFSVPGATGCGQPSTQALLNAALDIKEGLPAREGHNTAILHSGFMLAAPLSVQEATADQ